MNNNTFTYDNLNVFGVMHAVEGKFKEVELIIYQMQFFLTPIL